MTLFSHRPKGNKRRLFPKKRGFLGKSQPDLKALQEALGYDFGQISWLEAALHHPSSGGKEFQRLEFLGDRVLALVISAWLFERHPEEPEGLLAKRFVDLVKRESLYAVGQQLELVKFLKLDTQKTLGGRVIPDACESLLGAVFLDGGLPAAEALIRRLWAPLMASLDVPIDAKSALQEALQAQKRALPVYRIAQRQGPSHNPWFIVEALVDEGGANPMVYQGQGSTRRKAEQHAAQLAHSALQARTSPEGSSKQPSKAPRR